MRRVSPLASTEDVRGKEWTRGIQSRAGLDSVKVTTVNWLQGHVSRRHRLRI